MMSPIIITDDYNCKLSFALSKKLAFWFEARGKNVIILKESHKMCVSLRSRLDRILDSTDKMNVEALKSCLSIEHGTSVMNVSDLSCVNNILNKIQSKYDVALISSRSTMPPSILKGSYLIKIFDCEEQALTRMVESLVHIEKNYIDVAFVTNSLMPLIGRKLSNRFKVKYMGDTMAIDEIANSIIDIVGTRYNDCGRPKKINSGYTPRGEEILISDLERSDIFKDEDITEIMINGSNRIYLEKNGKIEKIDYRFASDEKLMCFIERLISKVNRRVDESSPMVDARLSDGSRFNAIIPPLSLSGPIVTIRRFKNDIVTIDNLVEKHMMSQDAAVFLERCVRDKKSIIVSGSTGSGKTTMLKVLSKAINVRERIITIEDSAELNLNLPHLISLEAKPPNIEGEGGVSIRDLLKNALRMRPDRIIIGECRSSETLDMLQAMNTGHAGSMTTVHSNSTRDAIARIETMVLMAKMDLPIRAIREQISRAIDIMVHTEKNKDGVRKITEISEVTGMEGDIITLNLIGSTGTSRDDDFKMSGIGLMRNRLTEYESVGIVGYD